MRPPVPCWPPREHPSPEPGLARKHDETYKLIFSQRAAIEELVRNFVGEGVADELDFDTLEELRAGDSLPPVLPVTVYNGRPRWRAPTDISELIGPVPPPLSRYLPKARHLLLDLQRIGERDPSPMDLVTSLRRAEGEPSPENLRKVIRDLVRRFSGSEFAELRSALSTWLAGAAEAWQIPEEELARIQTLTEDDTMWERVSEMRDQVHRDGVRKGLEQGLEQGRRAEGRALVGRLATRKFGAETAERLSRVVEDIADPERFAEIADAIIDCDSDVELFAQVGG
ncbi:MAG: hypothetical protein F4205_01565 [Gemmatimonadetes bacterium]|nr:hypothetical protein [Gemmatimonadota bacterium]MYG34155.1 hypothetical protein [Gemmatimonadota bacterium]